MKEVEVRSQETIKTGEMSYAKFTLHVKAIGSRAAKMKTRAWVRKNALIVPAVPKISEPDLVAENDRPLAGRNVYKVETVIWR